MSRKICYGFSCAYYQYIHIDLTLIIKLQDRPYTDRTNFRRNTLIIEDKVVANMALHFLHVERIFRNSIKPIQDLLEALMSECKIKAKICKSEVWNSIFCMSAI